MVVPSSGRHWTDGSGCVGNERVLSFRHGGGSRTVGIIQPGFFLLPASRNELGATLRHSLRKGLKSLQVGDRRGGEMNGHRKTLKPMVLPVGHKMGVGATEPPHTCLIG